MRGQEILISAGGNNRAPCKNCERREVGCHARCGDYKAYRAAIDSYNERRKTVKDAENIARDMEWEARRRIEKRRRH